MYLQKISLINFKNYEELELQFSPKINCFIGNNGVGKTNLLDAIYYLSMCKSYSNILDHQNILHEKDFFVIQGAYIKEEKEENLYCGFKKNKKKIIKRNKKEYDRLSDHIGLFPIVMISPIDSALILDGSEERRKFINGVISQYDKTYLDEILKYNRVLNQRNSLLKSFADKNNFDISSLEIWDEQLITYGEKIFEKRQQFVRQFLPIFQKYYQYISQGNEEVVLNYESQLNEDNLGNLLNKNLEKDRILQYTTNGIHKDDLVLKLAGYPIKKIGSQGQQKTFLVALKFSQFDFIKEIDGFKPIVLLDDIFDKLDDLRVKQIIQLVADNNFGQIFITDTSETRIRSIFEEMKTDHKFFRIREGKVE